MVETITIAGIVFLGLLLAIALQIRKFLFIICIVLAVIGVIAIVWSLIDRDPEAAVISLIVTVVVVGGIIFCVWMFDSFFNGISVLFG